jgi:hypothetical protein
MSRREERERAEYSQRQQHEAINRSIDETKNNIRKAIEEIRRETPRYSQTVTDFQNETAEATREIADNFLDSQKEVINSMQSAWIPFAERTGGSSGNARGYYWMGMMQQPWWSWMGVLPRDIADIYARGISAMTDSLAAGTRMATNMMFAGIEATRATTNYARQNSREVARITSNTARIFGQTTRETFGRMQEGGSGETTTPGAASSTTGRTTGATEESGTETARRK